MKERALVTLAVFACWAAFAFIRPAKAKTKPQVEVTDAGPEIGVAFGSEAFLINHDDPRQILSLGGYRPGPFKSVKEGLAWFPAGSGLTSSLGALALPFNLCGDPVNTSVVYAPSLGDGLFRSVDFGDSWTPIGNLPNPFLADCAVDPDFPNVIYVLTSATEDPLFPGPLFKSHDGGLSFTEVGNGLPDLDNSGYLAVSPSNPDFVYVSDLGTFEGVYRSTDGGLNFALLANSPFQPVYVYAHPTEPDWVYVVASSGTTGLFRSTDAGASFSEVTAGFPPGGVTTNALSFDPADSSIVYAGTEEGLFRSSDGGASFSGFGKFDPEQLGALGVLGLGVDPSDSNRLYVNTSKGNFRSVNGGKHFQQINRGWRASQINHLTFDNHARPRLYVATYNTVGILRTVNEGKHYGIVGENLPSTQVTSLEVGRTDLNFLVAATLGGIFTSLDGGNTWTGATIDTGQSSFGNRSRVALDPGDPEKLYAVTTDGPSPGFYRSLDGGQTFVQSNAGLTETRLGVLAVDPNDPQIIYVGASAGSGGIFKSNDGGLSFAPTGQPFGQVAEIVINPEDSQVVYVGFRDGLLVRRSLDGGASFSPVNQGLSGDRVYGLVVDSNEPARLFAWLRNGGVFMTADGGDSWTVFDAGGEILRRSSPGLPNWAMAIDPANPNVIYIGSGSLLKIEIQP